MNRQILASMNEICNELEDLGLYKSATEITEMMVRISQSFFEKHQQKMDYSAANNAYKAAGMKKELDPEKFFLSQDYDRDLFKKKQIPKTMSPEEIGRFLAKHNVDVNKLKLYFSDTQGASATPLSGKNVSEKSPPLGSRVESGKTQGMTDNELVNDYVELAKRNFQIHNMDKVAYWEDHAKDNLSPKAYDKFSKIDEKMHDQYITWMQENPEAAKRINALKPQTSEDRDPFEKQSPETPSGTTPATTPGTTPTGNSSGLDRWVNKAENIYKAWSDKNMPENSTAPLLIKDVLDYMMKVKDSLSLDKIADAQAKIDKVQSFIDNINNKIKHTGSVAAYSEMTGFGGKEADPFGKGKRLDQKKLDYLAKQESKSY